MKIVCINLDRATDRWDRFTKNPNVVKIKHSVERFSAVDKYDVQRVEELKAHYKNGLAIPHASCFLSHMLVLEEFVSSSNSEDEYLCVFEDDAELTNTDFMDVETRLREINVKSENMDMLYLSKRYACNHKYEITTGCGTEAYIVTRHGAAKMLRLLQPSRGPIDININKFHHSKKIDTDPENKLFTYKIKKPCVRHNDQGYSFLNKP